MSGNESDSTPKGSSSKIPIRIGSATSAKAKESRVPNRYGCESPKKIAEKHSSEMFKQFKISESADLCTAGTGNITEPHRITISESLPLAPTKGSEGDQFWSRKSGKKSEIDFPVDRKKPSINVLMEPRLLRENVSGVQMTSLLGPGNDSLQSMCTDKSCEEVGEISEVGAGEGKFEDVDVWQPVSDYLLNKSKMRTTEAQTSEASNIEDMDCVESGKYSDICSYEKIPRISYLPGKIKQCSEINDIKIRHPTPKSSLMKMTATPVGIPVIQVSGGDPDIPANCISDDSLQNKLPAEKGDLKRKDTYTVFTEEDSKGDMIVKDGGDSGDGNQISAPMEKIEEATEENKKSILCVNISKITPSALRHARSDTKAFEVSPQALLLIPDIHNPGGFIATLKISNNSANIRAYKVCVNKYANSHLRIQPQYGIITPFSEIEIEVLSRSSNKNAVGGLCQAYMANAILEIRSIEVFNMANQRQLSKLWRMAEARFSDSISSVKIRSINVLEPRNSRLLGVMDEPESSLLKNIMQVKYSDEMLCPMAENREEHLNDVQLSILEGRVRKVWICVKHMDYYLDIGIITSYFVAAYCGFIPFVASHYFNNMDMESPSVNQCETYICKIGRYFSSLTDLL